MQQIIDMPVPLAIANRQRYFLCAGQTRLNLGLDNIRKIIGERDESETLWLQVMNKNFISPNLLNNSNKGGLLNSQGLSYIGLEFSYNC